MNRQELIQYVDKKFRKKEAADFRVGDTVKIQVRIIEGDTTRLQAFEGVVISIKGMGTGRNFTVRKISFGVGVERTFPLTSPTLEKIEVIRSGHVRRAKLYYLRERVGRAAKLEEREGFSSEAKKIAEAKAPATELATADKK